MKQLNKLTFNTQLIDDRIDTQKKHIDDISNQNKDTADSKKIEIHQADTDIENYVEDIKKS